MRTGHQQQAGGVCLWLLPMMSNDKKANLRLKAEACRRLADMAEDAARKAQWLDRVDYWEQVAMKGARWLRLQNQNSSPSHPGLHGTFAAAPGPSRSDQA